jgi:hypothetical protein
VRKPDVGTELPDSGLSCWVTAHADSATTQNVAKAFFTTVSYRGSRP